MLLLSLFAISSGALMPHAKAAGCFAGSCNGKNPTAMGCAADARTLAPNGKNGQVAGDITVGYMHIELRYSDACNAAWVRIGATYPGAYCNGQGFVGNSAGAREFVSTTCDTPGSWYSNMVSDTSGQTAYACGNADLPIHWTCTGKY